MKLKGIDLEKEEQAARLRGSLLEFMRFFYEHITGRKFIVSQPIGRESHHITICKELTKVFNLDTLRLIINVPPGHNKSTMLSMWIAWCWAHYPDSNFLYISYSHDLAAKHTAFIKTIVACRMYQYLFDIDIDPNSRAKDSFKTTSGGSIMAFGSLGAITGQDAGLLGVNRCSGAVVMDDSLKLTEAHSDAIREKVIVNYDEAIRQRCRGMKVPIVNIEQRSHEADLPAHLMSGKDVDEWTTIILPGLDAVGNALYPEFMSKEKLLILEQKSPYVFASQIQQNPMPAGGALFKPDWFIELDYEPNCILTFITADTAETDKSWNDATVFSFWGLYEIEEMGHKTGDMGLHWLDCLEVRIEPVDLEKTFLEFHADCMRHRIVPRVTAIEKKSTGVTLISTLKKLRGLEIREIDRNKTSGSKTQRFIDIQSFVASKLISFTTSARHKDLCINHMKKITANGTHRHDDIADTLSDAIRIALIEKTLYSNSARDEGHRNVLHTMNQSLQRKIKAGAARYGRNS